MTSKTKRKLWAVWLSPQWVEVRVGNKKPVPVVSEVKREYMAKKRGPLSVDEQGYPFYGPSTEYKDTVTIKVIAWKGGRHVCCIPAKNFQEISWLGYRCGEAVEICSSPFRKRLLNRTWRRKRGWA